jgi:hypothetical protein
MSLYRFGAIIMYTAVATVCVKELIPVGMWMYWMLLPVCSVGLVTTLIMED